MPCLYVIIADTKNSIHISIGILLPKRLDLEYRLMNSYGIRIQNVLHCVVT